MTHRSKGYNDDTHNQHEGNLKPYTLKELQKEPIKGPSRIMQNFRAQDKSTLRYIPS